VGGGEDPEVADEGATAHGFSVDLEVHLVGELSSGGLGAARDLPVDHGLRFHSSFHGHFRLDPWTGLCVCLILISDIFIVLFSVCPYPYWRGLRFKRQPYLAHCILQRKQRLMLHLLLLIN
jgi:hypothetical protein